MMEKRRIGMANSVGNAGSSVSTNGSYRTAFTTLSSYATPPSNQGHAPNLARTIAHARGIETERHVRVPSTLSRAPENTNDEGRELQFVASQEEMEQNMKQVPHPPFSSEWLAYLDELGILRNTLEELDWSGRGQHVEYGSDEDESIIPLKSEKQLGFSSSALVDRVRCRRVLLARKRIRTNRRLTKEEAVKEVRCLEQLHHNHIVRVVGTYTHKKDLAILLYPAAEWNLEEFMDDTVVESKKAWPHSGMSEPVSRRLALGNFIGCLSNAICFIHEGNIKHMDIKPKNLLVRPIRSSRDFYQYKIYIADFGIARSYRSAPESETDSPTSFTRAYAAPEVVMQDLRGLKADIFSLGCVMIEIVATTITSEDQDVRADLLKEAEDGGSTSYHTRIPQIQSWLLNQTHGCWIFVPNRGRLDERSYLMLLNSMIEEAPYKRPTARQVINLSGSLGCGQCGVGPEPFEAS